MSILDLVQMKASVVVKLVLINVVQIANSVVDYNAVMKQ